MKSKHPGEDVTTIYIECLALLFKMQLLQKQ